MEHYVGIDVSLDLSSLCVLDVTGKVIREAKVASEPEALVAFIRGLDLAITRVGLEAGPLSQWLYDGLHEAGLAPVLLETRHVSSSLPIGITSASGQRTRRLTWISRTSQGRPPPPGRSATPTHPPPAPSSVGGRPGPP